MCQPNDTCKYKQLNGLAVFFCSTLNQQLTCDSNVRNHDENSVTTLVKTYSMGSNLSAQPNSTEQYASLFFTLPDRMERKSWI